MNIRNSDKPTRSEIILTEYTAMRGEIEQRSNAQLALITLNLTAVGALGSFALTDPKRLGLLIIVAFICPSIGLLWVDHAVTIDNIGDYIRERLNFRWEDVVVEERVNKFRRLIFGLQIFFLFGFPAAISLYKLRSEYQLIEFGRPKSILELGWNVGVLFLLIFFFALWSHIATPIKKQYGLRKAKPQALWNLGYSNLRKLRNEKYGFQASGGKTGDYNNLFGRDSLWILIFLLKTLEAHNSKHFRSWVQEAGQTIIRKLCELQGTKLNNKSEEQPGKIIHEYRNELNERLREMNLGFVQDGSGYYRLYSGFDETFLFIIAYRQFSQAFKDSSIVSEAWPHVIRALEWIEHHADHDRDRLFEYDRLNLRNYPNQVWKDSFDSITATNADLPLSPIAWIDVQAYAYRAYSDIAEMYRERNDSNLADKYRKKAEKLRELVNEKFWMEKENCFAVALDGEKRQIEQITSNVGHALWAGLVTPDRVRPLIQRLSQPDMTTCYGLRTLSSNEAAYAPYAYHRGCIWPFDNAIYAMGLMRNEYYKEAYYIMNGVGNALKIINSPIELYVVLDTNTFLGRKRWPKQVLSFRRTEQRNKNQGWTAAALLYFAATLAQNDKLQLKDDPAKGS